MRLALTVSLALGCAGACGGGDEGFAGDAGVDGDSGTEVDPWATEAPAPPVLTPCPAGWTEALEGDVTVCLPWPEGRPSECGPGEVHHVGAPSCARVGAACPAGEWAEGLPSSAVLYVREGATGGDGTRAAPYDLAEAIARAAPGTVIALARGTYVGPFSVGAGITLHGACATETHLTATTAAVREPVVDVTGGGVVVRDLRIGDAPRPGIAAVGAGRSLELRGVVVERVQGAAIGAADGATLVASDVLVRDVDGLGGTGPGGYGIVGELRAAVELERVFVQRAHQLGIGLIGGEITATIADTAVHDTLSASDSGVQGHGMLVSMGAVATVVRSAFVDNRDHGILAGEDAALTLDDSYVARTRGQAVDGDFGRGIGAQRRSTVTIRRALLEGNSEMAVFAGGLVTEAVLEDVVIRDQRGSDAGGNLGRGLNVATGAVLRARRALLVRNRDVAAAADGEDTLLSLEDVRVLDTLPITTPGFEQWFGLGVGAAFGARVEIARAEIAHNRAIGVVLDQPGTTGTLTDVWIHDTLEHGAEGQLGRALSVQRGAVVEVEGALFEASREASIFIGGTGSDATLSRVAVRGVAPRACVASTCPDNPAGSGVVVREGAVRMSDFLIHDASLCGIQVAFGGQADLRDGEISSSSIGACVQADGFDVARLSDGVVYRDNDTNLDATTLPVPDTELPEMM